ncbi:MAG: glycosyl transferase [Corynebacteriales bacterium]|nr:glycosyl transferase [Mycobacteriales bacterium]
MASTATTVETAHVKPQSADSTSTKSRLKKLKPQLSDIAVAATFILIAIYVQMQVMPALRYGIAHPGDPYFFEWMFSHAAYSVTHLENPFFTERLGAPQGVNILANTSVLGLGIPLAPVTLLFGAHTTYLIAITAGLAATGISWYWLLSRHVTEHRAAAMLGAAICGFGPAIVSHAHGHVNFVSQFLVPIIVWRFLKLAEPGSHIRNGIIFGLVASYQIFIGEEVLFFTGLACLVFGIVFAITHRIPRPRIYALLKGFGVALATATPLLAYPLYMQFLGPQAYHGIPEFVTDWGADLTSYIAFSSESLAGDAKAATKFAPNSTEENTFIGFPLVLVLIVAGVWLRKNRLALALTITGVTFFILSLGPTLIISGTHTRIPLPWRVLQQLPLFNSVLPGRLGLVVWPICAVLVALALDKALSAPKGLKVAWIVAISCALLPIAPTPLASFKQGATPVFFASGHWRDYLSEGRTLATIPLPSTHDHSMRWAVEDDLAFRLPRGYFLGPATEGGRGMWGSPYRPTSTLLDTVAYRNRPHTITDKHRAQAAKDFEFWQAGLVVLPPHPAERALLKTMQGLLGPAQRVDDVWIWQLPAPR